jgi:hypothetical protein
VALRAAVVANADRHAQDLASVVHDIQAGGATSLRAIAAELYGRGMLTQRGGRWHVSTVANLLDRLGLYPHRASVRQFKVADAQRPRSGVESAPAGVIVNSAREGDSSPASTRSPDRSLP